MKYLFLSLFILNVCVSSAQSMAVFDFLKGKWQAPVRSLIFEEEWKLKPGENFLSGSGKLLRGDSIMPQEKIRLYQKDTAWIYEVTRQGETQPVDFTLTASDSATWTFSNKQNAFPVHIQYRLVHQDSMVVRLSNSEGNKEMIFRFQRME